MNDAIAFVYELVRRLAISKARISSREKRLVTQLPKFNDLSETAQIILQLELWSFWKVRPVAYQPPLWQEEEGYCQPALSLDLTADFNAAVEVLKRWYHTERGNRNLPKLRRRETLPFRVTWERVSLLEKPYGPEKNRLRERAIELAKKNLPFVIKASKAWKIAEESHQAWQLIMENRPAAPPNLILAPQSRPCPIPIWRKITLSRHLRPSRNPDRGTQ